MPMYRHVIRSGMGSKETEAKNTVQNIQRMAGKKEKRKAAIWSHRLEENHYFGTIVVITNYKL